MKRVEFNDQLDVYKYQPAAHLWPVELLWQTEAELNQAKKEFINENPEEIARRMANARKRKMKKMLQAASTQPAFAGRFSGANLLISDSNAVASASVLPSKPIPISARPAPLARESTMSEWTTPAVAAHWSDTTPQPKFFRTHSSHRPRSASVSTAHTLPPPPPSSPHPPPRTLFQFWGVTPTTSQKTANIIA